MIKKKITGRLNMKDCVFFHRVRARCSPFLFCSLSFFFSLCRRPRALVTHAHTQKKIEECCQADTVWRMALKTASVFLRKRKNGGRVGGVRRVKKEAREREKKNGIVYERRNRKEVLIGIDAHRNLFKIIVTSWRVRTGTIPVAFFSYQLCSRRSETLSSLF